MADRWKTMETVTEFIFLGSKSTVDDDCSHEIKRHLLLGRKAMTNLDNILKSRDTGKGNGNPLHYSCLEKSMDRGAWQTAVHGVTWLSTYVWGGWRDIKLKLKSLSHVQIFTTPWTVAYHAPPSMGFSRQEYWSGLPFPSPEDLPNPGIEPGSPAL